MKINMDSVSKRTALKAQISLELLFSFMIMLSVMSVISLVLIDFYEKTRQSHEIINKTLAAQHIARELELLASSGNYKAMHIKDLEGNGFRVKGTLVITEYNGKEIAVETMNTMGTEDAQNI